jgi:predicted alpha/beta superfamily hydrolase
LYVNDGQNAFDARTSVLGIDWGIDDTAELLISEGLIQEIIIVAVYNTPWRTDEYTPIFDPMEGGGRADDYAAFLVNELMPFINKRYKTSSNPMETGIMGSSFGGLNALYIGWKYSHIFSIIGAVSPSLWFGENFLARYIAEDNWRTGPSRIWMCMGTEDDDEEDDEDEMQFSDDYDDEQENEYDFGDETYNEEGSSLNEYDSQYGGFYPDNFDNDEDFESFDDNYQQMENYYEEYYGEEYHNEYYINYDVNYNIEDLRNMRDVLLSKGYELEHNLFYREVEGAGHNERDWGHRTPEILMALFPNNC